MDLSGLGKLFGRKKQRLGYSPSIYAKELGIKMKLPKAVVSGARTLSGLELRPIAAYKGGKTLNRDYSVGGMPKLPKFGKGLKMPRLGAGFKLPKSSFKAPKNMLKMPKLSGGAFKVPKVKVPSFIGKRGRRR